MLRGINRQTIFEDDEDREMFIGTVNVSRDENNYKVYAYCLMDNRTCGPLLSFSGVQDFVRMSQPSVETIPWRFFYLSNRGDVLRTE